MTDAELIEAIQVQFVLRGGELYKRGEDGDSPAASGACVKFIDGNGQRHQIDRTVAIGILEHGTVLPPRTRPDDLDLPLGVQLRAGPRGGARFRVRFKTEDGATHHVGTFASIPEAVAARDGAIDALCGPAWPVKKLSPQATDDDRIMLESFVLRGGAKGEHSSSGRPAGVFRKGSAVPLRDDAVVAQWRTFLLREIRHAIATGGEPAVAGNWGYGLDPDLMEAAGLADEPPPRRGMGSAIRAVERLRAESACARHRRDFEVDDRPDPTPIAEDLDPASEARPGLADDPLLDPRRSRFKAP